MCFQMTTNVFSCGPSYLPGCLCADDLNINVRWESTCLQLVWANYAQHTAVATNKRVSIIVFRVYQHDLDRNIYQKYLTKISTADQHCNHFFSTSSIKVDNIRCIPISWVPELFMFIIISTSMTQSQTISSWVFWDHVGRRCDIILMLTTPEQVLFMN